MAVNAINNRGEMVGGAHPPLSLWPPDPALPNGPVYWASPTSPPHLLMQVLNGYAEAINQRGVAAGWFLCAPDGPCPEGNDFRVNPPAEPTIFDAGGSTAKHVTTSWLIVSFGEPGSGYPLKTLTCQGREETALFPSPYSYGEPTSFTPVRSALDLTRDT